MKHVHLMLVMLAVTPWLIFAFGANTPAPSPAPSPATAATVAPAPAVPVAQVDRLKEALASVGATEADLGVHAKGYWYRYPDRVPYKMHFFDSLHQEPLRTYEFTRTMTDCLAENIGPDTLIKNPRALYYTLFYLGIDHKIGGFRAFGSNLDPDVPEKTPLLWEAKRAYEATGSRMRQVIFSNVWNKKVDWPDPEADIQAQTKDIDPQLEKILAELLANVIDAYKWRQTALRKVDSKLLRDVYDMRSFHAHSSDGHDYPYQVDDLMKQIDEESLYYAAQKAAQAAQDAARQLKELVDKNPGKFKDVKIDFPTPLGRVAVNGTGNDKHEGDNYAILIDLGGDDVYDGAVGATTSLDNPISICIDLSGNDQYRSTSGVATQGSGIFGTGILIDLSGDDVYDAPNGSQGYGLFGLGLLVDCQGNDKYTGKHDVQGAAHFGIGMLLDGGGNDSYYAWGDCMGFGGPGGVGVLGDVSGSDTYSAERLASKAGRPDYHSKLTLTTSSAMGCGSGSRADGSNGHAWAGGIGALLDLAGDDKYDAANFAIGCGYWFGTGILYDGGGNDSYHAACYSIASGCHFGISAILDEAGNDRYVTDDDCEVSIASGRDYEVSLLLDKGGDDYYQGPGRCVNFSEVRSTAMLLDLGGNDTYVSIDGPESFNAASFTADMSKSTWRSNPSGRFGQGFAILLDIGGQNKWVNRDFKTRADKPCELIGDGKRWFKPAKGTPQYGFNSFGIGVSVPDGTVNDLLLNPLVRQ